MAEEKAKHPDVSVVVPVFNSENTIEELFNRIQKIAIEMGQTFEVVFVEDWGSDKSWSKIVALKKKFPDEITAIRLSRNFGQNSATLCGMRHASGKYIVTLDDDLQTPPEEIPKLFAWMKEKDAEIVYGIYPQQAHSWFRNTGSQLIKKIFFKASGGIRLGSSFRLLRKNLVEKINQHEQDMLFIDQVVTWHTFDIAFAEVQHENRKKGKSGYTTIKLIGLSLHLILHYTVLPLRLMTYIGLFSSLATFGVGTFYLLKKFFYGAELGYTSLIVAILFSSSIILFSLGIVGEYISRIYASKTNKPVYSIHTKL